MTVLLRPAKIDDSDNIWQLIEPARISLTGMTALPSSPRDAVRICEETSSTIADLSAGSFEPPEGSSRRILFVAVDVESSVVVGVTGTTFKVAYPNLAVNVTTSGTGTGLIMASESAPWSRTELDSSFIGPQARGTGVGTLLSRGRFMLLQIVRRQIPAVVAAHLRGVFRADGTAPFWEQFGRRIAPQWETSTEAEAALDADPSLLAGLAGHELELTASVLDSLGAVNAQSLPAFHLLSAEGLTPNGMYDPIDGGPTVVADLAQTTSARYRQHGRVLTDSDSLGEVDGLVSVAAVDRFRVVRAPYSITDTSRIALAPGVTSTLNVDDGDLVAVSPLKAAR